MDELICPLCGSSYDEFDRVPLMIPDCGHTFCKPCISVQLLQLQGKNFLCPEDNKVCQQRTNINQFPINSVLLKFLQTQRRQHKSHDQESRFITKSEDIKDYKLNNYCTLQQDVVDEQPVDLCPEHFQKLDIVCLTDRARICTKCALFGQHKQHEFRSVEDVVKEVTLNAENIMHIYQQIQNKQGDLSEQKCFEMLGEKFKTILKDSHNTVKEKFKELQQILVAKEQKITEQVNQIVNTLEQQCRKQISEIIIQCSSSVELWKITAKDRLLYFSQTTELGDLPLDLYNSDFSSLEKGKKILEEIDKTLNQIEQKGQNVKVKKLKIDCKKKELEKTLDSLFTLTLQYNNNSQHESRQSSKSNNLLNDSMIQQSMVDLNRVESMSKMLQNDIFSSFCYDDPMLLKDVSLADWNEIQDDDDCTREIQGLSKINMDKHLTPQKLHIDMKLNNIFKGPDKNIEKKRDNFQKNSYESGQYQNSPANKMSNKQDENKLILQVGTMRSGISPTPKLPMDKKKKIFKINEKFDQIWQAIKNDTIDTVDLSNADLQDEGVIVLGNIVKQSKKMKTLKVVRNRITDDGACKLLDALLANQHQQFFSLHMQSNLITEKTLDYYIYLVRSNPNQGSLPKSLYLNQNLINSTKAKKKLDEIRKLGLTITV